VKKPFITYIFLTVNVLIWLFTIYYSSKYKVSPSYANFKFGAKINHLIMSGEYWRLVTPGRGLGMNIIVIIVYTVFHTAESIMRHI
jgi:hypothetical protein